MILWIHYKLNVYFDPASQMEEQSDHSPHSETLQLGSELGDDPSSPWGRPRYLACSGSSLKQNKNQWKI